MMNGISDINSLNTKIIHFILYLDIFRTHSWVCYHFKKIDPKGLTPPYYENKSESFEFFGGDDTDDNIIFTDQNHPEIMTDLLKQAPPSTYLAPLAQQLPLAIPYTDKYILDLKDLKDYQDYIDKYWFGKARNNLMRQVRNLYRDYRIEVVYNNYTDLDLLFQLNIKRFGDKSSFNYPYRQQIFKDFIEMFQVETITLKVNDVNEAFSYGIKYKDTYLSMNNGVSTEINNLGKLLILLQIDRAIRLGCSIYDAGKGEGGWKDQFKLSKIPQFQLTI